MDNGSELYTSNSVAKIGDIAIASQNTSAVSHRKVLELFPVGYDFIEYNGPFFWKQLTL
jgi:hypothetical protein